MNTPISVPENTQLNYDEMSRQELINICREQAKLLEEMSRNIKWMMEQIKLSNKSRFGSSSDSVVYPEGYEQPSFFNEAEVLANPGADEPSLDDSLAKPERRKKKKEKGKKERDLSGLPVTIIEHELPDEQRSCPECGNSLHDMKMEVTKILKFVPAHMEVEEHRRHVYTCRNCEQTQEEGTKIPFIRADMLQQPIPGSFASAELIAAILNGKYVNAMPLARQEKELECHEVAISRQTMSNWILKCAEDYFSLIYNHMRETLLKKEVLHADETYVQVVREPGREAKSKSYMWTYCTGIHDLPIVYFEYHQSRAFESAEEFLKGYKGYLHTDGYEVYHKLNSGITVVGCLAHIRRRFTDCIQSLSEEEKKTTFSYEGLQFCDNIFHIDKKLKDYSDEERYQKRLTLLKPVMDAFLVWLKKMKQMAVPKTHFYEAVNYALNQWTYFQNVLLDGRLELSNNLVERSLRPFTIGRKNWMTMETPRGATASAMIYSVVTTARNNNLKPYNYLVYILKEMPNTDFINHPELIGKFVPWSTELPADCYKQDRA